MKLPVTAGAAVVEVPLEDCPLGESQTQAAVTCGGCLQLTLHDSAAPALQSMLHLSWCVCHTQPNGLVCCM